MSEKRTATPTEARLSAEIVRLRAEVERLTAMVQAVEIVWKPGTTDDIARAFPQKRLPISLVWEADDAN